MNTSKKAPEGFEWAWNPITECNVLRPIKGFSEKYLTSTSFVPQQNRPLATSVAGKNNSNLHAARVNKYDEFFTTLPDIVSEMRNYTQYFRDKVIYCPCDKAFNIGRSNFVKYFMAVFHTLGIRKLICTQYNPNGQGQLQVIDFANHGFKWEYHGEYKDGTDIDESMIDTAILNGNGSFDSEECRCIMKESDIVVTNPPFSKFKEFLAQILEYDKKFIIIGNLNAVTYKEIFPLIKGNKVWLGMTNPTTFNKPDGSSSKFGNTRWFTNLEHNKRIEGIYLSCSYTPDKYPKYDNYDAIHVETIKTIPNDYTGLMGVPITLIEHYNPNQFELIGCSDNGLVDDVYKKPHFKKHNEPFIEGEKKYKRIFVRMRQSSI